MNRRGKVLAGVAAAGALTLAAVVPDGGTGQRHITVQANDGWLAVARRCGSTVEAVKAANPAEARLVTLYVGEVLHCPDGSTVVTTAPSSSTTSSSTTSSSTTSSSTTSSSTTSSSTTLQPAGGWSGLGAGAIPGPGLGESAFRSLCEVAALRYDDPIVYPGQPGASHLHMFFGNDSVTAASTYQSLRATGESSCQGGILNRSGYWAPALQDGNQVRYPDDIVIYYKGHGPAWSAQVQPLPLGLKMIAGYDMDNPAADDQHYWNCGEPGNLFQKTINTNCATPAGATTLKQLSVRLGFPDCWDGVNLDSANHRSHVSYQVRDPNTGQTDCPGTHPVKIPQYSMVMIWNVPAGDSTDGWHLSSDVMPGMTHAPGSTFHGDWIGAWDVPTSDRWLKSCIREYRNCNGGELGDGGVLLPNPNFANKPNLVPIPLRG